MSNTKHTPGPWAWHFTEQDRPYLATPDRGRLYVMGFARKGMQGATAMFSSWTGILDGAPRERMGGVMVDLHEFRRMFGMHPDARLIAAAPELLEALRNLVEAIEGNDRDSLHELIAAHAAIAKATGSAS